MLRAVPLMFMALVAGSRPAFAGDAAHGKLLFAQCSACHGPDAQGTARGPALAGIIGRSAGQLTSFRYSNAMRKSGITWSEEMISKYLVDPQAIVPGNRMPFSGVSDASQGMDIAAYLATLQP